VAHSRSVIYSGADQLPYGDVAETLDTIRNAGAEKIGIATYEQELKKGESN
jgi:biopolymer transport protein ExbD